MSPSAPSDPPPPVPDLSPEARRRIARDAPETYARRFHHFVGRGSRVFEVMERVLVGTWNDGAIHAGNLAYMSMLAIFPFFVLGAAIYSLFGDSADQAESLISILSGLPPRVRAVIEPAAESVIAARSGWLLWAGGAVGLWTGSSFVETLRDILRRAYGTHATLSFWRYRLLSAGIIVLSVLMLMLSLFIGVTIGAAHELIAAGFPQLNNWLNYLSLSHLIPAAGLFGSVYLLFLMLAPEAYRSRRYPKWPGALAVTLWVLGVTVAMPRLLGTIFAYDLNYGSLAGIMIALFFFWLVGLGMVAGAELNAALARTPEEEEAEA